MTIITELLTKLVSGVGPFFLLLGLLIFVHEMGHYLVAVFFGVRVETFSLGFGKKIFSYKRNYTTYALSIIPLGGYVKMFGDDPGATISEEEKKYSFLHQPVWPRIAIVLAGPIMNLIFAIFIFSIIGMVGEPVPGSQLGDIDSHSSAYTAGFRSGDTVLAINSSPVHQWREVRETVENHAGGALTFEVQREGTGTHESVTVTPALGQNDFLFTNQREVGKIDGLETDSVATMVGVSDPQSRAALAGIKTFDIIEKVDGQTVSFWRQLEPAFKKIAAEKKEMVLEVSAYDPQVKKTSPHKVTLSFEKIKTDSPILEQVGLAKSDLFLLSIKPKSPAALAGLKNGDRVITLDGQPVISWQSVLDSVKSFKPEHKAIDFVIVRDGKEQKLTITPEKVELPTEQGAMENRYAVGVGPAIMLAPSSSFLQQTANPIHALAYGFSQSWEWSKLIAISFVRLVQGEVSARNIGGVLTIGRVASKSFEVGLVAFLKMMAIISINLFLLNLLPVPVLDGGHLVFFSLEAIKGAPISFRKLEIAQQVGLVLLMSLMIFALFNDITNLISSW